MILQTKRLILRDLCNEDAANIVKNLNNLDVSRYLLVVPYPYSLIDAQSFIEHCKKCMLENPRKNYEFGIERSAEEGVIGMMSLTKIDHFQGTATMGYWLGENYWRQRISSEAAREVLRFAFSDLGLRRINITAAAANAASNGLIRKLGFVPEGVERQGHRVKSTGLIYDVNTYGMLREEWEAHKIK